MIYSEKNTREKGTMLRIIFHITQLVANGQIKNVEQDRHFMKKALLRRARFVVAREFIHAYLLSPSREYNIKNIPFFWIRIA